MQKVVDYISRFINEGDKRSANAKKNIIAMIFLRGLNILIGFLIVPLTINYVDASMYGVWLALSSILIWISYFDFGLLNSFRNNFAESRANGDYKMAKTYVSTTYFTLGIIFSIILCILLIINENVNWCTILKISDLMNAELHGVFIVLSLFLCIRIVSAVITFVLLADQKPALSSAVQTLGQLFALLAIYILIHTTTGNLFYLALALSGIPCLVTILLSFIFYRSKKYRQFAPSYKYVKLGLAKNVMGKGLQFFVITIAMLMSVQIINVAISRELSPLDVTRFNLSFKYFSVIYMGMELIVSPFWSAFTESYTLNDFPWMRKIAHKLEFIILLCIPIAIIMVICANFIIKLWIRNDIYIPLSLHIIMGVFAFFQSVHCIYSNLINGTGKIRIQLIVFTISAIISLPLITWCIQMFGLWGCMILPTLSFFFISILCNIQIHKIINQTAKGIWNK